jgi:hypothetical protein
LSEGIERTDLMGTTTSTASGHVFMGPVKADIQPYAPEPAIARSCRNGIKQLSLRGANLVVILLDREQRSECPSRLASAIRAAASSETTVGVEVVIKNRTYENWLIADLSALRGQPARYAVSNTTRASVEPNKADSADALMLLKRCCTGSYDKVADSKKILARADIVRIGKHSRSFRRFLGLTRHPRYSTQTRQP